MSFIEKTKLFDSNLIIDVDTVVTFQLEEVITTFEQKVFNLLTHQHYEDCEHVLTDFCFELCDLPEREQVFIARTFFISIITDMMRVLTRKKLLHPRILSHAYKIIAIIEKWKHITEYILGIPAYLEHIKTFLITEMHPFSDNIHVEKARQLIHYHIKNSTLTVQWLAQTLGISTTHLTNTFKLATDQNISQYIIDKKVAEICYQLTYTNKSLKTIRTEFNFKSDSYFTQYFKRAKGITPLQYKKEMVAP